MKQYLLPKEGQFYKANLHMHSTCSDGRMTPEEIKAHYRARGYSVVAFTDHDIMIDHSDLNDENFLALTSYEVETNQNIPGVSDFGRIPTYHLNFYAPVADCRDYPCPNPRYCFANAPKYVQDYYRGNYERRYSTEGQNEMIAEARKKGFLVSYNHPCWSLQHYPDYAGLQGLTGVEVYNSGCVLEGFSLDAGDHVLQDLLCLGKRVYPLATDDAHSLVDCCLGWTCLKAPTLTYTDIMHAFEVGDLYASWGPRINELYLEEGILHVACSAVKEMFLLTERRHASRLAAETDGGRCEGTFDLRGYFARVANDALENRAFFRLVLVDAEGNRAMTRGYFADELTKDAKGQ